MLSTTQGARQHFPGYSVALLMLAFVVYANSFTAPFLLDDISSIKNNSSIRQLWPPEPAQAGGMRGRPLVNFTFALNHSLGGTAVGGYHAVNLFIHASAGLVLMGVLRRTLRRAPFDGRYAVSAASLGFLTAAFWTIHPLQTEAVTYLSQRTESLMGLCYLLTLYCFIRAMESVGNSRAWLALAVLACFAGIGCKENMVTAPVLVLLYDRTFVAGSFREAWRRRRGFYLALATSWIALAGLMWGLDNRGVGFGLGVTPWQYALTESRAIVQYFWLSIWPATLVFDYGSAIATSLTEVWPYALIVTGTLVGVACALKRNPVLGFVLAWPFIMLGPSSSFIPLSEQPVAEHRMYLALAGLAALAVVGLHRFLGRKIWFVALPVLLLLGARTYQRNFDYSDEIALWEKTLKHRPNNDRALNNLGSAYLHTGRIHDAQAAYESASKNNPRNFQAVNNLGFLHAQMGRSAEAMESFKRALVLNPGFAEAHYNLGCLLLQTRQISAAKAEFEQVFRQNPDHSGANNNLATILAQAGQYREAVAHYTRALRTAPADEEIYANRAVANYRLGRLADAIKDYEQALRIRPTFTDAKKNLELLRAQTRPL